MSVNEIFNHYVAAEGENDLKVVHLSDPLHYEDPIVNEGIGSSQELLLIPLYFVVILGTIVFVLGLDFRKVLSHRITPLHHSQKIPCWNCKFFKNNPYLKCAVQPSKVLSTKAIDCTDYRDQTGE